MIYYAAVYFCNYGAFRAEAGRGHGCVGALATKAYLKAFTHQGFASLRHSFDIAIHIRYRYII